MHDHHQNPGLERTSVRKNRHAFSTCSEAKPSVNRVSLAESWDGHSPTKTLGLNVSSIDLSAYRRIRSVFYPSPSPLDLSGNSVSKTSRVITHLPITRQRAKIQPGLGDLQRRLFPWWWLCALALRAGESKLRSSRAPCSRVYQVRYWLTGPEDGEKVKRRDITMGALSSNPRRLS